MASVSKSTSRLFITIMQPISCFQYIGWYIPFLLRDVFRLCCFVLCLSPGFLRFFWYYVWTSGRIVRKYSNKSCRESLDVYLPKSTASTTTTLLAPVVVFYTGGAWVIGYKMWGALMARALQACGLLVVIPDYRNYPCASVPEMVEDVESSLSWVKSNIRDYGGNPEKVVICGQSAGGHLACTWLLKRALEVGETNRASDGSTEQQGDSEEEMKESPNTTTTTSSRIKPTDFRGFISLSAPYDLDAMQSTFRRHGLDEDIVDRVFDYQGDSYTPTRILEMARRRRSIVLELPPFLILHGTHDKTVPYHGSAHFVQAFQRTFRTFNTNNNTSNDDTHNKMDRHPQITFETYQGWSHTDGILEMPMNANHKFHKDVFESVRDWTDSSELAWPDDDPVIANRLCPPWLVSLAQATNPF